MRHTKTLLPLTLASAVLATALYAALGEPSSNLAATPARAPTMAPTRRLAAPPGTTARADVLAHTLRYRAEVRVGGEPAYALDLRGTWESEPLRVGPDGASFAAALRGASVDDPALTEQLATPFRVHTDVDGRLVSLAFDASVGDGARNTLRAIAALAQVVRPGGAGRTWDTPEQDATGRYVARYRHRGDTLTKSLGAHTHLVDPDGLRPVADLGEATRDGGVEIRLDAQGEVDRLEAHDAVSLELGRLAVTLDAELDLERSGASGQPLALGALEVVDLGQPIGVRQARERAETELAGRHPTADLLDALTQATGSERAELAVQLTAKLRADEALAETLVAGLLEGRYGAAEPAVLGALGGTGSTSTQRALVRLGTTGEPGLAKAAIAHLGLEDAPTTATLEALAGWMGDEDAQVHATATLAYGSAARSVGAERAAEMLDDLLGALDDADGPDETSLVLDALGNTGAPEALGAVREALSSPDPDVRRAAVGALRHVPHPDAEVLIAEALAADPHPMVRLEAVRAAASRGLLPMLPALAHALRADPERTVRLEVVVALRPALSAPGVEPLLVATADDDADPDVRRAARRVVSRLAL